MNKLEPMTFHHVLQPTLYHLSSILNVSYNEDVPINKEDSK